MPVRIANRENSNQRSSLIWVCAVCLYMSFLAGTVNPVLSSPSKIDKTKVLKSDGSSMKVESIAECSLGAFCNTFDLH